MPHRLFLLVIPALAVAACGGRSDGDAGQPRISAVAAFPNVPLPPEGVAVGSEGSGEALQLLFSSVVPGDSVVAYYRDILSREPYRLLNESKSGAITSFYVESAKNQPMWIRVEGLEAGGTLIRMVGAGLHQGDSGAAHVTPDTAGRSQ